MFNRLFMFFFLDATRSANLKDANVYDLLLDTDASTRA